MKTGPDWYTPDQLEAVGYFATKFGVLDTMLGALLPSLAGLRRATFELIAGDRLTLGAKLRMFKDLMEQHIADETQRERLRTFVRSLGQLNEFRNGLLHSGLTRIAAEGDEEARLLTMIGRRPGVVSVDDCHARGDQCEEMLTELTFFVLPVILADPTPLR